MLGFIRSVAEASADFDDDYDDGGGVPFTDVSTAVAAPSDGSPERGLSRQVPRPHRIRLIAMEGHALVCFAA